MSRGGISLFEENQLISKFSLKALQANERRCQTEHSHALSKSGLRNDVCGDGRSRGVRKRERSAVQHTAYKRQIESGKYKVSDRHQRHSAQTDDEDDLPLSVVQHPADERTEHYRDDREERRRKSGDCFRTAQVLNIERKGENGIAAGF